jgi:hypothetical protein
MGCPREALANLLKKITFVCSPYVTRIDHGRIRKRSGETSPCVRRRDFTVIVQRYPSRRSINNGNSAANRRRRCGILEKIGVLRPFLFSFPAARSSLLTCFSRPRMLSIALQYKTHA